MFLIDTNVLMAASAVFELSNVADRAMPQEIELREEVYNWLENFEISNGRMVMDEEGLVREEYDRQLPFNRQEQEYGLMVLQNKLDRNLVEFVPICTNAANGEHIAVLTTEHEALVKDREDRKWVACAQATDILHGQTPPIVYGAETDWFIADEQLRAIGLEFTPLLPVEWYIERLKG